jgi:hypothetical protein
MYIEIEHPPGIKRHIFIDRIQASPDQIKAGFGEYCKESTTAAFKKGYIVYVLSHARLSERGCALRLDTPELINEHIGAANIQQVFEAVIVHSTMDEYAAAAEEQAKGRLQ